MHNFKRRHWLFRMGASLLALIHPITQGAGWMSKTYKAEEFFDGLQLEVAKAIDRNDMAAVRKLAAQGADLKTPGRREMDLLWYAAGGATGTLQLEAMKTLVSLGVNPDAYSVKGLGSVLDGALGSRLSGREDIGLRALLDGGLNPNHRSKHGTPLLVRAVKDGVLPHVQLLVERGADLNSQDTIGSTAFDASLTTSQFEVSTFLLRAGANINTATVNGVTPAWSIHWKLGRMNPSPERTQFEELKKMIISRGVKWPPDSPEMIRQQMREKGLRVVVPAGQKQ